MENGLFFKVSRSTVVFTFVTSAVFGITGFLTYVAKQNGVFIFLALMFVVVGVWQLRAKVVVFYDDYFEYKTKFLGQGLLIYLKDVVEIDMTKPKRPFFKYKLSDSKIKKVNIPVSLFGSNEAERFLAVLQEKVNRSCVVNK